MITRSAVRFAMVLVGSALLVTAWSPARSSTTKTATFLVSLVINSDCSIAANPMNFGNSGVLAANVTQTTTLSVTCSNTTVYTVGLDGGNVATSTATNRLLANGAVTLGFGLYQSAGTTTPWGNTAGTNTVGGTGSGSAQTLTIYGIVPPQVTPAAGTYTSTVTASITF